MKASRSNPPIPCEDRFAQLKAVFEPNVETQRRLFIAKILGFVNRNEHLRDERIGKFMCSCLPQEYAQKVLMDAKGFDGRVFLFSFLRVTIEWLEFGEVTLERLETLARGFTEHSPSILNHYLPPFFGQQILNVIDQQFVFVHFTYKEIADEISKVGFKGNLNVQDLYSTKKGISQDPNFELGAGFIYAYRLKEVSVSNAIKEFRRIDVDDYLCVSELAVIGLATKGLEVFHQIDHEVQMIIPVECIIENSLARLPL